MEETKSRPSRSTPLRKLGTLFGVFVSAFILDQTIEFSDDSFSETHLPKQLKIQDSRKLASINSPHLLFITLDGVRRDEFMDCHKLTNHENFDTSKCSFPKLWSEVRDGRFHAFAMRVGNKQNLSLPGYQSIYGGKAYDDTCPENTHCDRIPDETWLEELKREFELPKESVASLASWSKMPIAVEKNEGTIFVNAGQTAFADPHHENSVPAALNELNEKMLKDPPSLWENARRDSYTFEYAAWYLENVRPRIMALGLLDSDEWGHLDHYTDYKKQLQTYDSYIENLTARLNQIDEYKNNTIIMVTTDHGRGKGWFGKVFNSHGPGLFLKHSEKTWFAVSVPEQLRGRLETLWKELELDKKPDQLVIRKLVLGLMTDKPTLSPSK